MRNHVTQSYRVFKMTASCTYGLVIGTAGYRSPVICGGSF